MLKESDVVIVEEKGITLRYVERRFGEFCDDRRREVNQEEIFRGLFFWA